MKRVHAMIVILPLVAATSAGAAQGIYGVPRDPAQSAEPVRSVVLDARSAGCPR